MVHYGWREVGERHPALHGSQAVDSEEYIEGRDTLIGLVDSSELLKRDEARDLEAVSNLSTQCKNEP